MKEEWKKKGRARGEKRYGEEEENSKNKKRENERKF